MRTPTQFNAHPDVMTQGEEGAAPHATRDMVAEVNYPVVPIKIQPQGTCFIHEQHKEYFLKNFLELILTKRLSPLG